MFASTDKSNDVAVSGYHYHGQQAGEGLIFKQCYYSFLYNPSHRGLCYRPTEQSGFAASSNHSMSPTLKAAVLASDSARAVKNQKLLVCETSQVGLNMSKIHTGLEQVKHENLLVWLRGLF